MKTQDRPNSRERAVAYDYDAQTWVQGADAAALRVTQLKTELEILKSAGAERYLRFTGSNRTVASAIAFVETLIANAGGAR